MGGVDEDGLISGLKEEELITNEEMDQLVKEVRDAPSPLVRRECFWILPSNLCGGAPTSRGERVG